MPERRFPPQTPSQKLAELLKDTDTIDALTNARTPLTLDELWAIDPEHFQTLDNNPRMDWIVAHFGWPDATTSFAHSRQEYIDDEDFREHIFNHYDDDPDPKDLNNFRCYFEAKSHNWSSGEPLPDNMQDQAYGGAPVLARARLVWPELIETLHTQLSDGERTLSYGQLILRLDNPTVSAMHVAYRLMSRLVTPEDKIKQIEATLGGSVSAPPEDSIHTILTA